MTRAVTYNLFSSGKASLYICKCLHKVDKSVSSGNFLPSIGLGTKISFSRLTLSAVPAGKCRGLNNVASRNPLDVGTRQDTAFIKSTFFVENLFSISTMALSRMESKDLFRD